MAVSLREATLIDGSPSIPTSPIGPGSIATPSTLGGPAFALSSTNWIAIQTYVIDGLALPTTDDASASKSTLSGTPANPGGLVKKYNDEFGEKSQDVIDCNKEIEAQKLILQAANDEYNHDVIVAATSPTYAWVWPVGTIAAAV